MDYKELKVQIALGTLAKDPAGANTIVKNTKDPRVARWGIQHSRAQVRITAIKNPCLPTLDLLRAAAFETSHTVWYELRRVLDRRKQEIQCLLYLLEDYPQLKIPFPYEEVAPQYCRG